MATRNGGNQRGGIDLLWRSSSCGSLLVLCGGKVSRGGGFGGEECRGWEKGESKAKLFCVPSLVADSRHCNRTTGQKKERQNFHPSVFSPTTLSAGQFCHEASWSGDNAICEK